MFALDSTWAPFISAVIVALVMGCVAPVIVGWVSGRTAKDAVIRAAAEAEAAAAKAKRERDQEAADRREDKQQDWARQDLVAERVAQAARDLAANDATVSDKLKALDDGQKVNHILLNSNMTRAMQADLDGKRLLLLALRRLAGSGAETSQEDADLILVTEAKVLDLEKDLAERAVQQTAVDAELAKQANDRLRA